MIKANDSFEKLASSYLFAEVGRRVRGYRDKGEGPELIRMDIGDVTLPIFAPVREAMHRAIDRLGERSTFRGYGPEQGYDFLRDAIADYDYRRQGIASVDAADIFISDGAKSDLGNLGDILSADTRIAMADPGYPVYYDVSVMSGREPVEILHCGVDNGFKPELPKKNPDMVILCSPCNPTGVTLTREDVAEWVEYARRNNVLLIFDSAYESFVRDENCARSIYEIEGAVEVAIEVRSFSKTAGFTGVRCGYTVVPRALKARYSDGRVVSLHDLWLRRQCTKFNGASYISQCGAAALYTPESQKLIRRHTDYYLDNARTIRRALADMGWSVYGGENSPYVWASDGSGMDSWQQFDNLLNTYGISTTPGAGFGSCGQGWLRFTGFNSREATREAMDRIDKRQE